MTAICSKLCIDLCAGKEGFSQAFRNDPEWEVVTLDVNKKFKPTVCADVRHLPFKKGLAPDVMLAGPPCERFSIAMPTWPKMGIQLGMQLVGAVFEAVPYLQPKAYLIENPMGRLRWFLGTPKQTIRYSDYDMKYAAQKKTDMWGNFSLPMAKVMRHLYIRHYEKGWFATYMPRDPAGRAQAPLGVSKAIKEGAEQYLECCVE